MVPAFLLDAYPDFAGQIAIHHSSIDAHLRIWIEENLSSGKLKAVVSTSSLTSELILKPVDTVIQIGSAKGVARFKEPDVVATLLLKLQKSIVFPPIL